MSNESVGLAQTSHRLQSCFISWNGRAATMAWKKRRSQVKELAEGLAKIGALQFGSSTLPDGSESSYLVNLKGLPSYPGMFRLVVDSMAELISAKAPRVDAFCCVPGDGLIVAAPLALAASKPLIYTRTPQGNERGIEGEVRPGWKVAVVGDLAASGKTILSTSRAIENEGGEAKQAFVLIDRLEGAREKLSKEGVSLYCVTDVMELADTLFSMELISEANLKAITRAVGRR